MGITFISVGWFLLGSVSETVMMKEAVEKTDFAVVTFHEVKHRSSLLPGPFAILNFVP